MEMKSLAVETIVESLESEVCLGVRLCNAMVHRWLWGHRNLYCNSAPRSVGHGVAMIRRLLKIIGFFCKRALSKRRYSAKETSNFQEPTDSSHPISENITRGRGGGLGSRPKKMYGERLGDGVEYHLMSPTPRR